MPQELKQVNGRWVVTGAQQSSDLAPTVRAGFKPAAPKPQAKPAAKPQAAPARRAPRPWWSKLINDIQYEVKASPIGALNTQLNLGVAGAGDNLARMAYSLAQRHVQKKPKADPSSGRVGNLLDQLVDHQYRRLGAKPPSQMSQAERGVDQMRRSVVGNLLVAPLTPGFGFASATTTAGRVLRGGAAFAFNEALSTIVDDSTGGNIVNMINPKLPLAVNVGVDDMVDAYVKSIIPNAATSLAVGGAVGGAASMFKNIRRNTRAHRAVQQEVRQRAKQESMGVLQKDEADGLDFTPQAKQPAQPAPAPEPTFQEANAAMEERLGMRQPQAAPEPAAAAPEPAPIPTIENATTEDFGKAQAAELPDADPSIDYWDYDPDLPESTALGKSLEELSDNELQTLLSTPDLPVVERVNQTIEARAGVEPRPPVAAQMVMAPTDRLADDYLETVTRKLGAREDYELRPLFDPEVNPGLWQRAQALTGVDDAAQLSKADMLDSLNAMAADGQAPIVNRMMGGQMLPTGEVQAAPLVFQYKGGVNDAGEQLGNSLEGVERWDPNAEGIIQVWRDTNGEIGQPGMAYVVNGHNRLAAAKRMGIPSMRVEYLDAPTAAEARLQGAISNVSDGKGTVFDAAKLAREYGITDPAQLKAMGKPGASGFWKEGIALGRLPEDVFTAAVNGQLGETVRKAVIIGESGANEETMRSAYRYLVQQGPDNVKEGTLREMLAMAQSSPAASSSGGRQKVLFEGTEWEQSFNEGMLAKADLAANVRQLLSREKKLFGTVGRQAGQIERVGQVDAGAAKDISGEASRALTIFDELKYMAGPVGDLLNEGTQRILAGESADQVAKGIKNRLAASIAEAMGKEVAPAVDVVQEDMFAAATRAAEPIELTPDERLAAEAQLLQQAAANGEIRPPTAPIPDLPEPAQVRLDQIAPTPRIEIPAAAARKLSPARERGAAESLFSWVNTGVPGQHQPVSSVEEALGLVRAKNQILDPDAIPGLDMDAARNDKAMGRTTANTEAVAAAYKQFYGLPDPEAAAQASARTAQATADEIRLAVEHKQSDAALAFEQQQALRDGTEYEALTFDEKKDLGLATDLDEVITPEVMPRESKTPIADALGATLRAMAESDARLFREIDQLTQTTRRAIDELGGAPARPVRPEPLPLPTPTSRDLATDEAIKKLESDYPLRYTSKRVESPADIAGRRLIEVKKLLQITQEQIQQLKTNQPVPSSSAAATKRSRQNWDKNLAKFLRQESQISQDIVVAQAALDRAEAISRQAKSGAFSLAPAPSRPEPLRLTASAEQPEFALPKELSKAAPRYGRAEIRFESDLDRTAYVLANDAVKPSKSAAKFREALEAAGMDVAEVAAHGKKVKAALKQAARNTTPGEPIQLPSQPFGETAKPPTNAGAQRVRQQIEANNQTIDDIRRKAQQEGC